MELQDLSVKQDTKVYVKLEEPRPPSCFSRVMFTFIYPLLKFSGTSSIKNEDTFPLPHSEYVINEKLSQHIGKHKLLNSLFRANSNMIIFIILSGYITVLLTFAGPVYMQLLMGYLEDPNRSFKYGLILAITFTIFVFLYPLVLSNRAFYTDLLVLRVRNSIFNIVYNKTLQSTSMPEGVGVNLLQIDTNKITRFFYMMGYLFNVPLQIGIAIFLIYNQVGNAVWVGLGTMASAMTINFFLASRCKRLNEDMMKIRDERMERSTELLTEIKMIKAYSWENNFLDRIQEIRKRELGKTQAYNLLYSFNIFYLWTLPSLITVSVLAYYTLVMEKELDSSKTFVTLTTLLLLQEPLRSVPSIISGVVQFLVSSRRIQELLDSSEFVQLPNDKTISMKDCVFAYGDKEVLKGINLDIQDGEFLAVIGQVGCGKSSLLLGLMGEIPLLNGDLKVNTDIAYAPSLDSWLLNASIRENIIMGIDFNENWYWQVVEACCLLADFKSLPAGDSTEIGERGINLSGGQKARINLARAVYSNKQVLLLDDPLSSVDNNVANHIFKKCFLTLLKGKTRILVTHRHNFLDKVDRVIELKDGKIIRTFNGIAEEEEINNEQGEIVTGREKTCKLIEEEDRETGEVDREVYLEYSRLAGSYIWVILAVICMALWLSTRMLGDIYLKDWANHPSETSYYLPLYIILKIGGCIFVLFRSILLVGILSIKASFAAHERLMKCFLRAPINLFYDITPLGRILNRLSKDLNTIDEELSFSIGTVIAQCCQSLSCVLMSLIFIPYLVVFLPFLILPTKRIGYIYKRASRELTRLESISRSPILNNYKQTLNGVKFVRVFGQIENFIKNNHKLIDMNSRINYSLNACRSWLSLCLGLLSSFLLSSLFWAGVLMADSIPVGVIGLCLTYMIPLPEEVGDFIVSLTSLENNMVSVERVKSYMSIVSEHDLQTPKDKSLPYWPTSPSISFRKVRMRYRPNTEEVLKGLTFDIPPGLRVGITGRTGSGKSSIFLALLRLVEIESGIIAIDGINIALLGLQKLRQSITLIPQDPLVFNGTLKVNLDPLGQFHETVIKKVIDEVQLKFSLDYEIKNSGQNISIGERQLISLSRAMICNTKILLFDETTAGIDPEMDSKIQSIISNKFKGCTLLTIAHRLGTILENDLILLLADGKLREMGSPKELLAYDSEFASLTKIMH